MKRKNVTLIEIMIVIVLIGLIGSVVAYNMRGSLDEGKAFKTRQGGSQIYNILMLEIAKGADPEDTVGNWKEKLVQSPLARSAKDLERDGWGNEYEVSWGDNELYVTSAGHRAYLSKHGSNEEEFLR